MTFAAYTSGIPNPPNDPSVDVFTMQSNVNAIPQLIDVDHVGFNSTYGGTHAQVQLQELSGIAPPGVPTGLVGNGFGTLYTNVINGNGELWYVRGASTTGIQLTGPGTPTVSSNGYTFLPGGILMEWGNFTATNISTKAVTFPLAFPNNVFNVQVTYVVSDSSTIRNGVESGTISKTGFTWIGTSTSSLVSVYWTAVGN